MFLRNLAEAYPHATWIHGGAQGFDSQVETIAKECGIKTEVIRPDYQTHGRGAPLVRNREIVDKSDVIVAGYDGRAGGGTAYTIKYAKGLNKEVQEIPPTP
jgi:hypothetical protein